MPLHSQDRRLTRLNLMPHLARLPVPEAHIPTAVSTRYKLAVGTDSHVRSIARDIMAPVALLAVLAETIGRRVDCDLVVAGLERNILARGVRSRAHHTIHIWFRNELDGDGDTVFPSAQRLVIRRSDEPSVLGGIINTCN